MLQRGIKAKIKRLKEKEIGARRRSDIERVKGK